MTSDEKKMDVAETVETPAVEPIVIDAMQASMTALGSVETGSLSATQSAIGSANVGADAEVSMSAVGMLSAKGASTVKQGIAGCVMAEGDATVSQGGAGVVIADKVTLEHSFGGALLANDAELRQSRVVVLLSRKTTLSEDSRVIFDWKAALILAAVLAGFAGIAALLGFLLVRKGIRTARDLSSRLPHLPEMPHLPELPAWVHTLERIRRSA
jgi:hypothetical protein